MTATRIWRLKSYAIDEVVRAADQWAAWDTLRDRPLEDFGLVITAEPDEDGDPVLIRTSALLFRWGRDDDAEAACDYAVSQGLPDTREVDRT